MFCIDYEFKKNVKNIAKIIIIVTVFLFGYYYGQSLENNTIEEVAPVCSPEISREGNEISEKTSLMLDLGNGKIKTFNNIEIENNTTVFDLLKRVTSENAIDLEYKDYGGDLGVLIESIDGEGNDMKEMRYWQYWLNNEYAKTGASSQVIPDGAIVEWKLIKGQFNE